EHVLELVHPRVGEEQSGIVLRYQRRAGHDAMAVSFEILQKGRPDVVRHHAERILLLPRLLSNQPGSLRGREALTDQVTNEFSPLVRIAQPRRVSPEALGERLFGELSLVGLADDL